MRSIHLEENDDNTMTVTISDGGVQQQQILIPMSFDMMMGPFGAALLNTEQARVLEANAVLIPNSPDAL